MSFRHRIYGETKTGWKATLIETDEGLEDLMIMGPGEVMSWTDLEHSHFGIRSS